MPDSVVLDAWMLGVSIVGVLIAIGGIGLVLSQLRTQIKATVFEWVQDDRVRESRGDLLAISDSNTTFDEWKAWGENHEVKWKDKNGETESKVLKRDATEAASIFCETYNRVAELYYGQPFRPRFLYIRQYRQIRKCFKVVSRKGRNGESFLELRRKQAEPDELWEDLERMVSAAGKWKRKRNKKLRKKRKWAKEIENSIISIPSKFRMPPRFT